MYETFLEKKDGCIKVVLKPGERTVVTEPSRGIDAKVLWRVPNTSQRSNKRT